jgi:hypothetical protein
VPFAERPHLRYVQRGDYEHMHPCIVLYGDLVFTIPKGERTNLASTPRLLWWWLPPTGAYEDATVPHDYLCNDLYRARRDGRAPLLPPRDVDLLFAQILQESDAHARRVGDPFGRISRLRRAVLFYGVRVGALFNACRRGSWRDWTTDGPVLALTAALLLLAAYWGLRLFDMAGHAAAGLIGGWL